MEATEPFDLGALYRSIDAARLARELSWSALSRQVGVAASTMRRFERASDAEADGVLTLIAWLGYPPETYLVSPPTAEELLPPLDGGVIRVDWDVIAEVADPRRDAHSGSRTTIQRLARLAVGGSRTIASLARWSAC